jgi:hypothetical protein
LCQPGLIEAAPAHQFAGQAFDVLMGGGQVAFAPVFDHGPTGAAEGVAQFVLHHLNAFRFAVADVIDAFGQQLRKTIWGNSHITPEAPREFSE